MGRRPTSKSEETFCVATLVIELQTYQKLTLPTFVAVNGGATQLLCHRVEIAHAGHVGLRLALATATPISGFVAFALLVLTLLVSPTVVCFVDRFTPAMLTPALVPERRCGSGSQKV